MLIYHPTTGLKEVKSHPLPAAKVGTYLQNASRSESIWKLRVKRRTKGSTWKWVPVAELPKQIKVEALLLGLSL